MKKIVLGGGCFWCIEAVFKRVIGVASVQSGYGGGKRVNPSYEQICSGATGHAEVVTIMYDEDIIKLDDILDIFFDIHNPTTLNAQGSDKGTQYRSVIYYDTDEEKELILKYIEEIQLKFKDKIVTEVSKLPTIYKAEEYHQNYYDLNKNQGYCQVVISPKLDKLFKNFSDKVK